MAERADADKFSHSDVGYEHPSQHTGEFCRVCVHFIAGSPPRCEAVKDPIRAADWCRRFKLGK